MALIKSISGIRGTIGGIPGDGLSPLDIVKFTAAYATFIKSITTKKTRSIVVGRDARLSGKMVNDIIVGTLTGMGFDVINIGLATTPTTELAVEQLTEGSIGILDLMMACGLVASKGEARRLAKQGGVSVDDVKVDENARIAQEQLQNSIKIRKGKKVFHKVVLK